MTLVEHLDELRNRIIFSGIFLVLAIVFCFWQEDALLDIANEPLPAGFEPLTFSPTEPFFTTVKLSVYGGILIALPDPALPALRVRPAGVRAGGEAHAPPS